MKSLQTLSINKLLKQFISLQSDIKIENGLDLAKLEIELEKIPSDIWIDHIKESDQFGVRMCLCDMAKLPIDNVYKNIAKVCRIDLLQIIVPFLLHMDLTQMAITSLDVLDIVVNLVRGKGFHGSDYENPYPIIEGRIQYPEAQAQAFYNEMYNIYEKMVKNLSTLNRTQIVADTDNLNISNLTTQQQEGFADEIQDLMEKYLDYEFFINTETYTLGRANNRLIFDVNVRIANLKTWSQKVKSSKLFPSDVVLLDIVNHIYFGY